MTLTELADRVDALATDMEDTAVDLDYFGGFNAEMHKHSVELLGAADIARGWANGIRELLNENGRDFLAALPNLNRKRRCGTGCGQARDGAK